MRVENRRFFLHTCDILSYKTYKSMLIVHCKNEVLFLNGKFLNIIALILACCNKQYPRFSLYELNNVPNKLLANEHFFSARAGCAGVDENEIEKLQKFAWGSSRHNCFTSAVCRRVHFSISISLLISRNRCFLCSATSFSLSLPVHKEWKHCLSG